MTSATPASDGPTSRPAWPWWGVAAGILGAAAHLLSDPQGSLVPAQRQTGAEVIELVDRIHYHFGAITGFLAVGCLLVLAVAWQRWIEQSAPANLAARVVPVALVASAGAMIIGYGFKGAMAVYLPGGLDAGDYPAEGLYTLFMINDLGPFLAWWGVAVAAAAMAWLGLRHHLLPGWIGIVSALAALAPAVFLAVTGLTGFAGIVGPLWLLIVSVGLASRRSLNTAILD